MKSSRSAALKSRWITIGDRSASRTRVQESPFGRFNDFADFRDFSLKGLSPYEPHELRGVQVKKADFSRASFSTVHFHFCKFEECLFDEAVFENDTRFWDRCEFVNCTFLKATFVNCAFNSVSFVGCSFKHTKWKTRNCFSICTFRECLFASRIKNIDFSDTNFVNSKFCGLLENVTFLGWGNVPETYFVSGEWIPVPVTCLTNKMSGVDFSDAELKLCTFSQYIQLDQIKPPVSDKNCALFITKALYMAATSIIEEQWKKSNVEFFNIGTSLLNTFYKPDIRRSATIAHRDDFAKHFGEDFSEQFFLVICLAAKKANATIT